MAVIALDPNYSFPHRDRVENFHGKQIVYVYWNGNRNFAAALCFPLPPDMPFGALTGDVIAGVYRDDARWENIDWRGTTWTLDGAPFTPDPARGLAEQGIGHKSLLRFTPAFGG